jgi:transposase-like protein
MVDGPLSRQACAAASAAPRCWTAGQRKKIAERYAKGETVAELARDYDCGVATIWRALRG